ncbi:signal-regulatory protein beta-1-like isoform X1 [Erpetoichthys calabaricus]|uniref:signal-regulatory protein beta-1-like isoform X1 n=1 Tax=Erpetoichthys calabaricus TaxID=27687 RepID=UPI0022345D6F|nr:signal-regulatory protein beta-1-like isoform X1 [Erpetoichthys calabaricus]
MLNFSMAGMSVCSFFNLSLVILLFFSIPDVSVSKLRIIQYPRNVDVLKGDNITLNCFVPEEQHVQFVRWYRSEGEMKRYIYSDKPSGTEQNHPRVTWVDKNKTINFSIRITNVTNDETGTYYCVIEGEDRDTGTQLGNGTLLNVRGLTIIQPAKPLRIQEGEAITLGCFLSNTFFKGPLKWYKVDGKRREILISEDTIEKKTSASRVSWAEHVHQRDKSIRITDATINDTGVYYCEKFSSTGALIAAGGGNRLNVSGNVFITGPPGRVKLGSFVTLTCQVNSFSMPTLIWLKDGRPLPPDRITTSSNGNVLMSRLSLKITQEDIQSSVECQKKGNEEEQEEDYDDEPLSAVFKLNPLITVMPQVRITTTAGFSNSSSHHYSCEVTGFYPEDIRVYWTLRNHSVPSCCKKKWRNADGTFSTSCHVQVSRSKLSAGAVMKCHAGYCQQCCARSVGEAMTCKRGHKMSNCLPAVNDGLTEVQPATERKTCCQRNA